MEGFERHKAEILNNMMKIKRTMTPLKLMHEIQVKQIMFTRFVSRKKIDIKYNIISCYFKTEPMYQLKTKINKEICTQIFDAFHTQKLNNGKHKKVFSLWLTQDPNSYTVFTSFQGNTNI